MALSPAEKQRRYRERLRQRLNFAGGLTDEQIADRDAVTSDPIYPVPSDTTQLPRFLGWSRYDWSDAPEEMIEHFGMRAAWEGWRREVDEECVRAGMPPEFDRGDLYRQWRTTSEARLLEYKDERAAEEAERASARKGRRR